MFFFQIGWETKALAVKIIPALKIARVRNYAQKGSQTSVVFVNIQCI